MASTTPLSTQERVFGIADELYAKGTKPTVRKVLSQLDDISSTSTVHAYLKEWWKAQEEKQRQLLGERGLSEELVKAFLQETANITAKAVADYKEMVDALDEQLDAILEDLQRSEVSKEKMVAKLKTLENQNSALARELSAKQHAQEATISELQQRLDEAKAAFKELKQLNDSQRIKTAKAEVLLENSEKQLVEAKSNANEAGHTIKALQANVHDQATRVAQLEAQCKGLNHLVAELRLAKERDASERKALQSEKQKLHDELTRVRQQLDDIRLQLADARQKEQELTQNLTNQRQQLEEKNQIIDRLTASKGNTT